MSPARAGVLPDHALRAAAGAGWIAGSTPLTDAQFQPSSLDLRLGSAAYQLRASFLPYREPVRTRLTQKDFTDGATTERLGSWEKFAQVLLETNEMSFIN